MALSLSFLGRCGDRWRVRVDAASRPQGLTLGLVTADGRPLGPAVVAPAEFESWTADLRGPCQLPSDAMVRATMDGEGGVLVEQSVPVRTRRGIQAWLHADNQLPLAARTRPAALSRAETGRLAKVFGWVCGCDGPREPERRGPAANGCSEELASLLAEFDVDGTELDAELIAVLDRKRG
jgi:hypothetical protein